MEVSLLLEPELYQSCVQRLLFIKFYNGLLLEEMTSQVAVTHVCKEDEELCFFFFFLLLDETWILVEKGSAALLHVSFKTLQLETASC